MAGVTREISYVFKARDEVTSVAGRVQKALKGARKSDASEALEEIGKIAKGAGAFAGVELVARSIDAIAEAMNGLREASERGAVTWAHYADTFFKSLPVINSVYEATRKVRFGAEDFEAERKAAITESINSLANAATSRTALAGKEGIDATRAQARLEIQASIKDIEQARLEGGKHLSGVQRKTLNELEARAKKEGIDKLVKIERDYYLERSKVITEGEGKIREMKAANAAIELRYGGLELQARIVEFKSQRDAQMRGLKDEFDEKLKAEKDPARRQQLLRQRGEEAAQIERARRLNETSATDVDRKDQNSKRFALANKGIEFLQREAELGSKSAEIEAQKLQIITEYAQKRQEIADLLAKENLPANQRDLLKNVLAGLSAQEQASLGLVGVGKERFSGGVAPSDESSRLTGIAAASRENDPANQIAKSTADIAKYSKLTYDLLNKGGSSSTPTFQVK